MPMSNLINLSTRTALYAEQHKRAGTQGRGCIYGYTWLGIVVSIFLTTTLLALLTLLSPDLLRLCPGVGVGVGHR